MRSELASIGVGNDAENPSSGRQPDTGQPMQSELTSVGVGNDAEDFFFRASARHESAHAKRACERIGVGQESTNLFIHLLTNNALPCRTRGA